MASSQWGQTTKLLMALVLVATIVLVIYGLRTILAPLVLATLFAYIFAPFVGWLKRRLHIPRGISVLLIYLIGLGLLATAPAVLIPTVVDDIIALANSLDTIVNDVLTWLDQTDQIVVLGRAFQLPPVELPTFDLDRIISLIQQGISPVAGGFLSVLRALGSVVTSLLFMAFVAFYLMVDAERIRPTLIELTPPSHREEIVKLLDRINGTWNAFLRGQLLLSLAVGTFTVVAMSILGVRFSIALGIVAGVLEIIPGLGPVLSAVPAVVLALFQGAATLPVTNFWAAVVVAGAYVLIQQLESNILAPRILGASLELHPLVVIVGVLAGATLFGILGALLAAPTISTLRHVVGYVYRKLLDMEPFPEPPPFAEQVRERDVRAILFDLDGTLLDTNQLVTERLARRLNGVPLARRLYDSRRLARRLVAFSERLLTVTVRLLGLLRMEERLLAGLGQWLREVDGQPDARREAAVEGVVALIRETRARYALAVVTSRSRREAERFIEHLELDGCFDAIVAREDVRRDKPSPEPIRRAAERLGTSPEQCIVVGDTLADVRAGKRAGALTVGVLCGLNERAQLERAEPDLIVETTAELAAQLPGEGDSD